MNRNERWLNEIRRAVRDECGLDSTVEQRKHLRVRFTDAGGRSWMWIVASTPSAQGAKRHALRELIAGLRDTFGIDCLRIHDFSIQFFVSESVAEREHQRKLELAWETFLQRLTQLRVSDPVSLSGRAEARRQRRAISDKSTSAVAKTQNRQ